MDDPSKYGLPTFEEFCKSPDKYRVNPESNFISMSDGTKIMRELRRHIYFIDGHRTEKLEEVQRIARDLGWSKIAFHPNLVKDVSGKYDAHITVKELKDEKNKIAQG